MELSDKTLVLTLGVSKKLVVSHFCRQVPRDLQVGYTLHDEDCFIIKISFFKVNKELEKRKSSLGRDSCVTTCIEECLKRPMYSRKSKYLKKSTSLDITSRSKQLLSYLKLSKEIQKSSLAG